MPVISVYWLAAQQQTNKSKRRNYGSIYSSFCLEENQLSPSFQKRYEVS